LPKPALVYDTKDQAELRRALEREDRNNRKNNADVELSANHLVLRSPNGARWSVTVSNAGVVSAVAL
jgi:hypothetical protein